MSNISKSLKHDLSFHPHPNKPNVPDWIRNKKFKSSVEVETFIEAAHGSLLAYEIEYLENLAKIFTEREAPAQKSLNELADSVRCDLFATHEDVSSAIGYANELIQTLRPEDRMTATTALYVALNSMAKQIKESV